MNIIGLGNAGCAIAAEFGQYPQYEIYKIDVDLQGTRCYSIPECETAEEYESIDLLSLGKFFQDLSGPTTFIVSGSGKISCASLRILEVIKDRPLSVLYVKPDTSLMGERQLLRERVVFGVLQEYARSGVFEDIRIVSNDSLDDVIGGAPILGYYEELNKSLVGTLHMLNIFDNTDPIVGSREKPYLTHRISTVGICDPYTMQEKMLFSLDNPREKCYIYGVSEEKLRSDKTLLKKITKQVKSKMEENLKVMYAIYSIPYDKDIVYVIERTPHIQLQNNLEKK